MTRMTKSQYESILAHARERLPNESCGLIGGTVTDGEKFVRKVYFLTNTDESPEHFSMAPEEQFSAVRDMRKNGWKLLGNFHSHPSSPSRPSEEDKRLAFAPALSYLILSLADDTPVLSSFLIDREKNVTKEDLIIE